MDKLSGYFSFLNNTTFTSIEKKLLDLLNTLPKLPKSFVDFILSITAYLALIGGVLSLISVLSLIFMGNFYSSMFAISGAQIMYMTVIGGIQALISGIMLIAAFFPLLNKKVLGWRLLFWSTNVSIIASLVMFNLFGAILSAAISWYFLSQIRSNYS